MKNLKVLNASGSGINQDGINGLDLYVLHVYDNNKITNIAFMKNLKVLTASSTCGIDQNGIEGLDLIELDTRNNNKITDVSFMKNLKIHRKD